MGNELELFKEDFIKGYIDPYMNRLLDLRNTIKNAKTHGEIAEALEREKNTLHIEFPEMLRRKNA